MRTWVRQLVVREPPPGRAGMRDNELNHRITLSSLLCLVYMLIRDHDLPSACLYPVPGTRPRTKDDSQFRLEGSWLVQSNRRLSVVRPTAAG